MMRADEDVVVGEVDEGVPESRLRENPIVDFIKSIENARLYQCRKTF